MFLKNLRISHGKAISCPAINTCCKGTGPIAILRPEIVIEERRWCPYRLTIRHYIERPEPKKINIFKRWYRKRQTEYKQKEAKRKEEQKSLEEKGRLERERCIRELRRLHSYHQSLCNRTHSLPEFSKNTKKINKTKPLSKAKPSSEAKPSSKAKSSSKSKPSSKSEPSSKAKSSSKAEPPSKAKTSSKVKRKSRSVNANTYSKDRPNQGTKIKGTEFGYWRACCDLICCLAFLAGIGVVLFYLL